MVQGPPSSASQAPESPEALSCEGQTRLLDKALH